MKLWLRLSVLLALVALLLIPAPRSADAGPKETLCFYKVPGIYSCIDEQFVDFWVNNGGLQVFGYPISAPGNEYRQDQNNSFYTQWFERQRLELHPENNPPYDILLGLLGEDRLKDTGRSRDSFKRENSMPNCRYFSETGFNLCGGFWKEWRSKGLQFDKYPNKYSEAESLALRGFPISSVQTETVIADGQDHSLSIQWMERARFEYHPGIGVLLGLLGNELYPQSHGLAVHKSPQQEQEAYGAIARQHQLAFGPLAADRLALSGFRDAQQSISILLTPAAKLPQPIGGAVLGGMTVLRAVHDLPADRYVITLDEPNQKLRLISGNGTILTLPAAVRRLLVPLARPQALFSSSQICLAWETTEICGQINLGLDKDTINQPLAPEVVLRQGFGLNPEVFDLGQSVTLAAGVQELETCARAFVLNRGAYDGCRSLVLAVPLRADNAVPSPLGPGTTIIGLVVVRQDIREETYTAPTRTSAFHDRLPSGPYLVVEVPQSDDKPLANQVRTTWIALMDQNRQLYFLPAVNLTGLLGEPRDPPSPDASVGASLILRNRCFFNVYQCPVPAP